MADPPNIFPHLDARRRELGMTHARVAAISGVSLPTVIRILTGRQPNAAWANVAAIANALEMALSLRPLADSEKVRQRQAVRKARQLMQAVQGTSGLEAQAVDKAIYKKMVRRTVHELLSSSNRKLWAE